MNKKKCNIYAKSPITCFTVPIVGHCTLNLTSNEIYKCLCARAEVTEILPNGKSINLDFSNYDKDNYTKPETPVVEEKVLVFEDKVEVKEEVKVEEEHVEEQHEEEETETTEEVVEEVKEEPVHEDPVKTQVASRNNNNNYQKNYNKKGKNKR